MDQFFKNLTSTIGNAAQGVGNFFSQQFSPAVQRFGQMAEKTLQASPGVGAVDTTKMVAPFVNNVVQGTEGLASGIGHAAQGIEQNGMGYFNPNNVGSSIAPTNNFWNTPFAKELAGQAPLPKFNFAEQINQNAGGGIPGFAQSAIPGMVEGILNVPSQIGQFSVDTAQAVNTNSVTPQKALGLGAELATPMLTVATMGKAPELLAGVKDAGWAMSALKGLLNGTGYGAVFGGLQGLQENQNAQNVPQQLEKTLPYIWNGMVTGGTLGTVLGPAGKFFFGNKEPGQTATLAQNGLIPPETMTDAYKILNVSPDATLPEVRQAYTNAAKEFHPQFGGTPESMDVLNNAYEMVTRNTAPTLKIGSDGNPYLTFSDEFGGNTLTQKQVAEARRAAADHTAFQGRIANLKAGRLPVKNPNQPAGVVTQDDFLTHGADLLTPEGQQAISAKTQQAAANQPAFHDLLDTIAEKFKGRSLSNIKNPESMAQKIVEHRMGGEENYGLPDVQDALRGTIVVKDKAQIPQIVQTLQDELQNRGWQRKGNGENYFDNPQPSGYEGYHLTIGMPDGQIAEVQIHTPQSYANAKLTHDVYSVYNDSNLPKPLKAQLKTLQAKIKTDPTAKLEATTKQYEAAHPSKALNPMESDFTGEQQPLTQAGAIAQRLQEANPDVDYRGLNYQEQNAQARDQRAQTAVDQARVKLGQPTTAEDIGRQGVQQAQTWNEIANQNHYVNNLIRIRDGIQARIAGETPTTTPEIDGLLKMRGQLQDEVNKAKMFIDQNRNNPAVGRTLAKPSEMRAHISDLNKSIKSIDDQVKSMQVRLKAQHQETTEGLKTQLTNLNKEIEQEQSKLRVKTATTQPIQLPNSFDQRAKIQDIVNRPEPENGTQTEEVPNAQPGQKTAAQQAFDQTKGAQQTGETTAKTQPLPNGVSKTGSVFTFSPVEGGQARTGTPAELGLTPSGKSKGMWEDAQGNQYSANYNPETETKYRRDAGLPTLKTPDELARSGQSGKVRVGESFTPKKGFFSALQNLAIPLKQMLQGSKDTRAHQLLQGVTDAQNWSNYQDNTILTPLEKARKALKPEDYTNATRSLEGKEQPKNQAVANWVQEARKAYETTLTLAQKSGIPVQKLDNYFTHTYTKDQIETMANDPDIQKGVIASGNATNPAEAATWIRANSRRLNANEYGSLHNHRLDTIGKYQYIEDPRIVEDYIKRTTREAGFTSVFGENMGKANQLLNAMRMDGNAYDASNAQTLLEQTGATYMLGRDPDEEAFANFTKAAHDAEALTKLGFLTPIHHLTSIPAIGARVGFRNMVKAVPELFKGLGGKFSDQTLQTVNRLHENNTSELYGRPTGLLQKGKFYGAIGLNKILDSLSAMGSKAALEHVNDLEGKLNTPEAIRDIQKAGLDYDAIQQRGYFTPEEKNTYVNEALKDASLLLSPEDMPKAYHTPAGRVIGMFKGPLVDRTFRMYPQLINEVKHGNITPMVGFLALSTLAGSLEQQLGNTIQNKPQQTPGQLLLAGVERGVLPVGGEEVANAFQYPEFAPHFTGNQTANALISAGINATGGPIAGDALTALTTYNNLNSQNPNDVLTGQRQLVREIPFVGSQLANTFLPYKSYVGNRPSDLVKILATGNKPQEQNGITVQHSPMDFVRANPQVAAQQAKISNIMDQQNAVINGLGAKQTQYNLIKQYEASGDPQQAKLARQMMVQDPALFDARAKIENISAKANGLPVDPRYDPKNRQTALDYLGYQNMTPAEKAAYVAKNQNVIEMDRQLDTYRSNPAIQKNYQQLAKQNGTNYTPYVHNPLYDTNSDGSPKFSNQEIASYRVYNQMQTGATKTSYLANHPTIMGAQIATFNYDQQQLQNEWDHRPKGQTIEEFMADPAHQNANIAGVDPQTGKIVPQYNLLEEPKYQIYAKNPQAGALIQIYKAAMANKNYTIADAALAKMPWYPTYQAAERAYFAAHPINSESNNELGGLGIDFSGLGGSGSGSGGGSYGSSSYMNNYLERQMLYSVLHDTVKAPTKLQFKQNTFDQRQSAAVLKGLSNDSAGLVKLMKTMPKIDKLPVLKAPKVTMPKLNFKPEPAVPQGTQGKVEAGRLMTKLQ